MSRFSATYRIETPWPFEFAASLLAAEQSTGTFVRVHGETDELRARAGAVVESIKDLGDVDGASLPGTRKPSPEAPFKRAEIVVSWPLDNTGVSLPQVLSTALGNLYELHELSAVKILDIDLPSEFAQRYPGPQFGMDGTRELAGVHGRPIVGTVVKPCVGLYPEDSAQLVKTLAEGGLDFVKDDELQANGVHSPFERRVEAVMRVVNDFADKTSKKLMVAFNITGEIDEMLRNHDAVVAHGGTCVMVAQHSIGLPAMTALRKHCGLPIHGHRVGWGMLTRSPALGQEFDVMAKMWRIAGIDHLHTSGLRTKMWESDESIMRSIRACQTPIFGGYQCAPVLSGAQWAGTAHLTLREVGIDLLHLSGGGLHAHPDGPAAGAVSVMQGWEAALAGIDLDEYAKTHPELAAAIAFYRKT